VDDEQPGHAPILPGRGRGESLCPVKSVDLATIRLFLHVLAATIWVGGQITLAALVPALRAAGTEVPKAAANAFNKVATCRLLSCGMAVCSP